MSSSPPGRKSHEMRSRESAGSRPSAVEPATGEGSELRNAISLFQGVGASTIPTPSLATLRSAMGLPA